jgi:hypothetical protein
MNNAFKVELENRFTTLSNASVQDDPMDVIGTGGLKSN